MIRGAYRSPDKNVFDLASQVSLTVVRLAQGQSRKWRCVSMLLGHVGHASLTSLSYMCNRSHVGNQLNINLRIRRLSLRENNCIDDPWICHHMLLGTDSGQLNFVSMYARRKGDLDACRIRCLRSLVTMTSLTPETDCECTCVSN